MKALEDYFMVIDDLLYKDECDMVLSEYKDSDKWKPTGLYNPKAKAKDETCSSILISSTISGFANGKAIDDLLFNRCGKALQIYKSKHKWCGVNKDEGYELLRYTSSDNLNTHVDSTSYQHRTLTLSIALSDGYIGGEWYFPDLDKKVKIGKGSAFMFPSNFLYPHLITPIKSGTRYSIVTWFV